MIANIQQHQYVTEVGKTAGLILLVQPQNMMPFPEDRGKLVGPGYQTEFAITQVLEQRIFNRDKFKTPILLPITKLLCNLFLSYLRNMT